MLMVVRRAAALALVGLAIGAWIAMWLADTISGLLFEVTPDLATVGGPSVILILTALLASYFPARRAAATDPMTSLRHR